MFIIIIDLTSASNKADEIGSCLILQVKISNS